jgi:hypothetical protein
LPFTAPLNSELLTCRKIGCNTNVCGRTKNTGFRANRSEFLFLILYWLLEQSFFRDGAQEKWPLLVSKHADYLYRFQVSGVSI